MNDLFEYKKVVYITDGDNDEIVDVYEDCTLKKNAGQHTYLKGQHFNKIKIYQNHPTIEFTSKHDLFKQTVTTSTFTVGKSIL